MKEKSSDRGGTGTGGRRKPSVLSNRKFARIFFAGVASTSGFSIGQVALTLIVYNETRSPLDVAYIGVSFIAAAVVFSLVAGALVDRHERRKLMVLSDLARAGGLAALIIILGTFGFNLLVILGVAFVLGSFTTLFQPAERALTPEVVGTEQIANANALVQTSNSVIQAASNAAGGILVDFVGAIAAFIVNTMTFVFSAVLIVGVVGFAGSSKKQDGPARSKHPSILEDIREGFRYIAGFRELLFLTVSSGFSNFFFSMVMQFLVFYAGIALHGGGDVYGYLLGLLALGWGPGAYLSARLKTVKYAGKLWIACGVADGLCILFLVAVPEMFAAFAIVFALGVLLGLANTTWLTIVQLIVPTEMQGRYFGLDQLGSFAVIPVGQVLGGILIAASGVNVDFIVGGVGVAVSSGLFVFSSKLRKLEWNPAT